MLNKKYGLLKRLVGMTYLFMRGEPVVISIRTLPGTGEGGAPTDRDGVGDPP